MSFKRHANPTHRDVLGLGPGLVVLVEDLVVVRVEEDVLEGGLGHVVVPVRERLEGVVDGDGEAGLRGRALGGPRPAGGTVAVVVVLVGGREEVVVEVPGGLVEELEHRHHLPVGRVRVLERERLDDVLGSQDVVRVLVPAMGLSAIHEPCLSSLGDGKCGTFGPNSPSGTAAVARVVVTVLAARSSVQVDEDLETVVPRPANGIVEVLRLTLVVGLTGGDVVRPVSDGNSDVVEAGG